ncbi:MAG: hypothetical protein V3T86_13330 [Planctomycetota bacterium]
MINDDNMNPDTNDDANPETSTDAGDDLEIDAAPMGDAGGFGEVPVAAAADAGTGEPAAPQEVRLAPPRSFPQHFSLLFASTMIVIGCATDWHRKEVFGDDLQGIEMISGAFLMAFAAYSIFIGFLNILQGRLRGMGSAFMTGFLAIFFSLKTIGRTMAAEANPDGDALGWRAYKDIKAGTVQDQFTGFIGQIGPGALLALVGGLIIIMVFIKAMLPKSAEAPAPSSRRRR